MTDRRRRLLLQRLLAASGLLLTAGLANAATAQAGKWPRHLFERDRFDDALRTLLDGAPMRTSERLRLEAPTIAENGASVPVRVASVRTDVRAMHLLVPGNPVPWVASFAIMSGMIPEVATRIRMAGTSRLLALAETADGFDAAEARVRVVAGGCEVGAS